MKKGKYASNRSAKPVALLLALVLVLGIAIGGTIAWLTDTTDAVVNTFTSSDVDIDLTETDTDKNFQMIPGCTIAKDPTVTVDTDSEDCYVFVQITEDLNAWEDFKVKENDVERDPVFKDYLDYTIAAGWTKLETGVYYREVAKNATERTFSVLDGNKVIVSGDVTKAMMDELEVVADYPTLTVQAFAIQKANGTGADGTTTNFTVEQAWDEISGT